MFFFTGVHCVTVSVLTSSPLQQMARVSGAATKVQILSSDFCAKKKWYVYKQVVPLCK